MTNVDEKNRPFEDSSAADEPTAMWDASALKDLGLEEAAKAHSEPPPAKTPAAPAGRPAVVRPRTVPKKPKSSMDSISLPMLALIAVALGLVVYFGVSLLLG